MRLRFGSDEEPLREGEQVFVDFPRELVVGKNASDSLVDTSEFVCKLTPGTRSREKSQPHT